jgi:hypothetical protein
LMALVDDLGAAAQGRLAALRENFEAGHEIGVAGVSAVAVAL